MHQFIGIVTPIVEIMEGLFYCHSMANQSEKSEQSPAYYGILPASVRYDKNLSMSAKVLFSEFSALCQEEGFCWASNEYFAALYEVSKDSISRWVSELADNGHIVLKFEKDNKRRVYMVEAALSTLRILPRLNKAINNPKYQSA